ncbi:cellulose-binding protein [Streptomyces sp. NPDC051954]|uniref:cellulose-binding protein n=1 Tax=unclassified Streptomyces TaxID=2593676 RepID=UPI0034141C4F
MSSASVSPHGFVAVRGRGYRPEQADAYIAALSRDRDAAWERAARLTVLAKEMDAEAARLGEVVSQLGPQTYEALGESARRLFRLVEEEGTAVREGARLEAQRCAEEVQAYVAGLHATAKEDADAAIADGLEHARQTLHVARTEADEIRVAARREVRDSRTESLAPLREARQHTSGVLAEQAKEHAQRWEEFESEEAERVAALEARSAEQVALAETALAEAEQAAADAKGSIERCQEEAEARAEEILAEARAHQDRIARETERVLREHGERWDEVRAHIDRVRNSLNALNALKGRATAE